MRVFALAFSVVASLGMTTPASAQEARTVGDRAVAVGDVAHRTTAMLMDVDATMSADDGTTAPMSMKMVMSEQTETRVEVLRAPTDRKGPLYRITVVRKEKALPMQALTPSVLQGRVFVVDPGKEKVKAVGGPKADKDAVAEVLELVTTMGNPFDVGALLGPAQRGQTITVGAHLPSADILSSTLPTEATVDVLGFEAGPHGERAMLTIAGSGQVPTDGFVMDIQMTGAGQVDVTTGWSLGMKVVGTVAADHIAVPGAPTNVHMSMAGPMSIAMTADYTTVDGQSFGYVAE